MATRYSSFLVRLYLLERGEERVEIEHVQSGAKARVTSVEAAATWLRAQTGVFTRESARDWDEPTPEDRRERRADRTNQ